MKLVLVHLPLGGSSAPTKSAQKAPLGITAELLTPSTNPKSLTHTWQQEAGGALWTGRALHLSTNQAANQTVI